MTHPNPPAPVAGAQVPAGINHLVLMVRDIDESHRFWTEILGFRHVATSRHARPDGLPPTRFYSGERDGRLHHHDIALMQSAAPGSPDAAPALDHIAVEYADESAWRAQVEFLRARGVALHRLIERGVTHSIHVTDPNGIEVELVFELPRARWEHDIEGALHRGVARPIPV